MLGYSPVVRGGYTIKTTHRQIVSTGDSVPQIAIKIITRSRVSNTERVGHANV